MSVLSMRCPICEGHFFLRFSEVADDRYGEPNQYQLARCRSCGHVATAPRLIEQELPDLYGTYYPRRNISPDDVVREAAKVQRVLAGFFRWWSGTNNQGQYAVRRGEVMLDVGCGSGTSLLEAAALGAKTFGIEADPNVGPIAEALGLTIHLGRLQERPFPEQSFDLIVMNQVIEHFPDPDMALQMLRERMAPNGRMILSFPNTASLWQLLFGKLWINWHVPYHLHHFNAKSFARMAQRCGFKVVRVRTITPNIWTLMQCRAIRSSPMVGKPNPIWAVPDRFAFEAIKHHKATPMRVLMRVGLLSIIAVMNRVVDAVCMGDSLLVELRRSGQ